MAEELLQEAGEERLPLRRNMFPLAHSLRGACPWSDPLGLRWAILLEDVVHESQSHRGEEAGRDPTT